VTVRRDPDGTVTFMCGRGQTEVCDGAGQEATGPEGKPRCSKCRLAVKTYESGDGRQIALPH
jgi:hypothetical protein